MKKLVLGLILCSGLSHAQNASIDAVRVNKNIYNLSEGDTVGFYVTFSKKLTNEKAYVAIGNGIDWVMMPYALDVTNQIYSLKDSLTYLSGSTYYGAMPVTFKSIRFEAGGSYNLSVFVINQPTGYIGISESFNINVVTSLSDEANYATNDPIVQYYDLQGRVVEPGASGLLIALHQSGKRRKVIVGSR